MRWLTMVLCCAMVSATLAIPDPKKYKHESTEKDKKSETLTNDEKQFLREVEEKFGVKSEVPDDTKIEEVQTEEQNNNETTPSDKKAFPAVIAIEIVNDTDSQSKGKRTIDANLGYGYRTNNGYSYTYFGKSNQDKGKFVIYPYSQEDPPIYNVPENKYLPSTNGKYTTDVEIQPSQAYELVPIKEEQPAYEYKKPTIEFKTPPSASTYSDGRIAQTLYTTYNGQELSGISGQFPTVMPNYFVDPSQLLKNPHYQNAGLTQDHLRPHSTYLNQNQRIVPVLVLRVPGSYLRNPTAELYANLPTNYPLAQHLNSVNLQSLVNQYFKNNGHMFAPNVMSYQSSGPSLASGQQHYSHPYVKPTYTQSDFSGVQYSAVKPVMARYPSSYNQQKYTLPQQQAVYQSPVQQQYEYRYVPQTQLKTQSFYIHPQYQQNSQEATISDVYPDHQATVQQHSDVDESLQYTPQYTSSQEGREAVEYQTQSLPQPTEESDVSQYISVTPGSESYAVNNENVDYTKEQVSAEYPSVAIPSHSSSSDYYSAKQGQQSSVSVQESRLIHTEQYQESAAPEAAQDYTYTNQNTEDSAKSLTISENYPSKDHTIATVLPYSYKSARRPTPTSGVQAVSYVTPMPKAKYQSQYRIMVPQTVLRNPNSERVTYVNSRPMHYTQIGTYPDSNSVAEYTAGTQYVSSVSSKPSYTRNFYTHPKRMARPDSRIEPSSSRTSAKKINERVENRKSS